MKFVKSISIMKIMNDFSFQGLVVWIQAILSELVDTALKTFSKIQQPYLKRLVFFVTSCHFIQ